MKQLNTPVTFIIFNRYEYAQKVFEQIRKVMPTKLFVVADGPRQDVDGEKEAVAKTRSILDQIDWDCELYCNFSEKNLGCGERIASGLTWVFSQVDRTIVLEDDCMASESFFFYCQELLEKYKNDERITFIAGTNYIEKEMRIEDSYTFSYFHNVWGWASWARAWKLYDKNMSSWPRVRKTGMLRKQFGLRMALQWEDSYASIIDHKIDTWDYQWEYAQQLVNGLSIVPKVNMIENIGLFSGTHMDDGTEHNEKELELRCKEIIFPLVHPLQIKRNKEFDKTYMRCVRYDKFSYFLMRLFWHMTGKI